MVFERTVDSCGAKKLTFFDKGNDSVLGRSVWLQNDRSCFATPAEAFDFLHAHKGDNDSIEICPELMIDDSKYWLEVAQQWKQTAEQQ